MSVCARAREDQLGDRQVILTRVVCTNQAQKQGWLAVAIALRQGAGEIIWQPVLSLSLSLIHFSLPLSLSLSLFPSLSLSLSLSLAVSSLLVLPGSGSLLGP